MLAGEIDAIITVFELPPRLSLSMKVSLLSLYGTCLLALEIELSTRVLITRPSTVRDLLILEASLSLSPWEAVYFYLSLPAKSTKLSLLFRS